MGTRSVLQLALRSRALSPALPLIPDHSVPARATVAASNQYSILRLERNAERRADRFGHSGGRRKFLHGQGQPYGAQRSRCGANLTRRAG